MMTVPDQVIVPRTGFGLTHPNLKFVQLRMTLVLLEIVAAALTVMLFPTVPAASLNASVPPSGGHGLVT